MKKLSSAEIRETFLDFFEEQNHQRVPSSSLVPGNDPTLLFTNAGMVQFKDVFLGMDKRDYTRATTAQKCMRVSGKHTDLDNVGPSTRHHTFFEMLGNFSFGDYFKKEACQLAYDLLTTAYGMPAERLYFTVHHDDREAYDIWVNKVGVPAEHVCVMGDKDNFWMMADVGPCGYTSEIHWDNRPQDGPATAQASFNADDGRFLEIWNLVFMQFEALPDGTRVPLPKTGVDTGMGLERVVAVLQGADNNYDTDLFLPIFAAIQQVAGHDEATRRANIIPYRVIADHLRGACFMIADGVRPGTQGRDYICRMVLRRAMRFGKKMGLNQAFLVPVADATIAKMGEIYPEIIENADTIRRTIALEETRFSRTMDRGLAELDNLLAELPEAGTLSGEAAFFLHATLGLPFEVTRDIAEERGYHVDQAGFRKAQDDHAEVSRQGSMFGNIDVGKAYNDLLDTLRQNGFDSVYHNPYEALTVETEVIAITQNGQPLNSAVVGERIEVVLKATPFYVESGGQVSDTGTLEGEGFLVDVEDVRRPVGGLIIHIGEVVQGIITTGVKLTASVDEARRVDITRNHTGTHLLHAALRNILGTHVQQRGSLVAPDRLRFDFSHDGALSAEELRAVQREVNEHIIADLPVLPVWKSLEKAKTEGAMALFGEKYGAEVRTISVGNGTQRYSYELCGGNHVSHTATIGTFVITQETSVAQGIRRIEAITGQTALDYVEHRLNTLNQVARRLQTAPDSLAERVESLQEQIKAQQNEIEQLYRRLAREEFNYVLGQTEQVNGVAVLVAQMNPTTSDTLREMTDWFRDKYQERGVVVLGMVADNGNPQLIAVVTKDLTDRLHAGNIIREVAQIVGGGGGGRPNMAQAGGRDAEKLPEALARARDIIREKIGG
jgi:alanyl-tRNA synthetase